MDLDLVQLQQSAKKVRNPFGFDFTVKWAKKPIVLKGDGEWRTVIAPLADHIANRLYMKIYYQYHDEQVAAMKAKGDDRGARAYRVPIEVENKIWMLITGLPKHVDAPVADDVTDEADLTELKKELAAVEKKAAAGGPVNITRILDQATVEALPTADKVDGKEDSGHVEGSARLSDEPAPPPADTTPVNAEDLAPQTPVEEVQPEQPAEQPAEEAAPAEAPSEPVDATPESATEETTSAPSDGEFGELTELDHGEQS